MNPIQLLILPLVLITGCSTPGDSETETPLTHRTVKTIPAPVKTDKADQTTPTANLSTQDILQSYAVAWKGSDEFALTRPFVLAFWIDDEAYNIRLTNSGGELTVEEPEQFDWGFETDRETLIALSQNRLNALTAMAQANENDPIPLKPRLPEGFDDGDILRSYYIPLLQHFWIKSWPETVPFGDGSTRVVHGANVTALIYDEGLRSAWYQLKPLMHINADKADQVNDFATAIIVTRGEFLGRLNGVERTFREGETVLIPEGMTHEFYATRAQYGEFIILMWGDNA